jgi:hypothetical protein
VGWTNELELVKVAREGWAGVRLCNLAAQSALPAEGSVQAGSGEGTDREGIGTVGDYLLQAIQDPRLSNRRLRRQLCLGRTSHEGIARR